MSELDIRVTKIGHQWYARLLRGDDTAMKVVHFIINSWLDKTLEIPKNFEYVVHSANPVGAENIRGAMDRFLQEVNSES